MIPGAAWPSVKPNQSTPSSVRDSFSKPKAKRDDEDTQQIYCCALTGTCVHIHMHHVHLTPSMCVCYTYIHTCMCTYTTYMYAHLHSQPNLISEIHTTKRPSLKKQSICRQPKKDTWICPLAVICMCTHMHGYPNTCTPAYAYTDTHQESSRRNAFWKAAMT